jgi:hypothetical protein
VSAMDGWRCSGGCNGVVASKNAWCLQCRERRRPAKRIARESARRWRGEDPVTDADWHELEDL